MLQCMYSPGINVYLLTYFTYLLTLPCPTPLDSLLFSPLPSLLSLPCPTPLVSLLSSPLPSLLYSALSYSPGLTCP